MGQVIGREEGGRRRVGQRDLAGQVLADVANRALQAGAPAALLRLAGRKAQQVGLVLAADQAYELQHQAADHLDRAEAAVRVFKRELVEQRLDLGKLVLG